MHVRQTSPLSFRYDIGTWYVTDVDMSIVGFIIFACLCSSVRTFKELPSQFISLVDRHAGGMAILEESSASASLQRVSGCQDKDLGNTFAVNQIACQLID